MLPAEAVPLRRDVQGYRICFRRSSARVYLTGLERLFVDETIDGVIPTFDMRMEISARLDENMECFHVVNLRFTKHQTFRTQQ